VLGAITFIVDEGAEPEPEDPDPEFDPGEDAPGELVTLAAAGSRSVALQPSRYMQRHNEARHLLTALPLENVGVFCCIPSIPFAGEHVKFP